MCAGLSLPIDWPDSISSLPTSAVRRSAKPLRPAVVPQFDNNPIDGRVGLTLGGVHIANHGEAPQTASRPQSARQADRGPFDGRGDGSRIGTRQSCYGICPPRWPEGRKGASGKTDTGAASRNSATSGQEALEISCQRRQFLTRPHPLTDGRFLPRASRVEHPEVTVCIAARSESTIFAASDRMLTSGDVQFEPSAGTKIFGLSNSMFMMTAGDAALQAEITGMVSREILARIAIDPANWWKVSEAADLYVKYYNFIRNKRAENAILSPLHLDGASFIANQRTMTPDLVSALSKELLNFEIPNVAAIFAGVDPDGTHIYTVHNNEANCVDNVGFAAIGIGGRHASSQFMFARHAWNSPFADTLLLTYYAKRKAEVAPGVGIGTDMVTVGPSLGSFTTIREDVIKKLDREYRKTIRSETLAFRRAKGAMNAYVEELTKQTQAAGAAPPETQASSKTTDGTPSIDQSKV